MIGLFRFAQANVFFQTNDEQVFHTTLIDHLTDETLSSFSELVCHQKLDFLLMFRRVGELNAFPSLVKSRIDSYFPSAVWLLGDFYILILIL